MSLPIIQITGPNIPIVWEDSIKKLWTDGCNVPTQYDKADDPPSKDCIAILVVENPFNEPRIHRAFPAGLTELEVYRQEVVNGIHDHWIDPGHGTWEYTYHERLFNYSYPGIDIPIDQIRYIIDSLSECPYTRRAQAITWKPWEDNGIHDPACLQRLHCRVINNELVMTAHMRSNDAFKAAFMNMFAFTDLQKYIAEEVSNNLNIEIKVGQYTHIADSYHIYGSYFKEVELFISGLESRSFSERTWNTKDVAPIFDEAKSIIEESLVNEIKTGRKGI